MGEFQRFENLDHGHKVSESVQAGRVDDIHDEPANLANTGNEQRPRHCVFTPATSISVYVVTYGLLAVKDRCTYPVCQKFRSSKHSSVQNSKIQNSVSTQNINCHPESDIGARTPATVCKLLVGKLLMSSLRVQLFRVAAAFSSHWARNLATLTHHDCAARRKDR